MAGTEWLEGYNGGSTDELNAIEDRYRVDSLVPAFEQAVQAKEAERGPDSLTEAERVIVAVEATEREVNNGGYAQFFIDYSHVHAPFAVSALRLIGCPETAAITQRAIDALGAVPDLSPETLEQRMNDEDPARDEPLARLDEQYFLASEPMADRSFEFFKQNRAHSVAVNTDRGRFDECRPMRT